jgi:hypothetical protein
VAVIGEFAGPPVVASDIYAYGYGVAPVDFLNDEPIARPRWVITNPPFGLACEFAVRGLELATEGVALLVRTQWIEGVSRYRMLFKDRPPLLYAPFVERVPMVKGRWDPEASTATSYAWFVWRKQLSGAARVFWIPPNCRSALTAADDRARFAAWSLIPSPVPLLDRID